MTEPQAIQAASRARHAYNVPEEYRFQAARRCIIEIVWGFRPVSDQLPPPGPVVDRIAWLVTFTMDPWNVEFAVDDETGEILRFRRSRGAALRGVGSDYVAP